MVVAEMEWEATAISLPAEEINGCFLHLNLARDVDGQNMILSLIWNFLECPSSGPCFIYCLKDW